MAGNRREWLQTLAAASVVAQCSLGQTAEPVTSAPAGSAATTETAPTKLKGRIKHSLVSWCYKDCFPSFDDFCRTARQLGCHSIELCDPALWPTLKKHGLTCAISSSHGFTKGLNNPAHQPECLAKLRERIEQAAAFGCPNVITFTGMRENIPDDVGAANCVTALKEIAKFAETKKVTVCLEMLNTRAADHPMKGHPGYQGEHVDYCVDILKAVGSPHVKLLFDIYHVQIMDGDVIRRIQQHRDWIGHIHTAGNPGRGELDQRQEIHYPAIMQALVDTNYQGAVGHEFIPTRDCVTGLREAIAWCDV